MTTTNRESVKSQGPVALLALTQHIVDHGLGLPIHLSTPSMIEPWFTIGITSASTAAWEAAGFHLDREDTQSLAGRMRGQARERVMAHGRLDPFGLRVCLTFVREIAARPLTAVSA